MLFALITLLCAVSLSAIAAYYSVVGLIAIFASAPIPIAIMGGTLEASKLVVASWLYKNWGTAPRLLKYYFTTAVVILMIITSLGIFGYLSKAHLDQAVSTGEASSKLEIIDEKIKVAKENIAAERLALKQLDAGVDQVMARTNSETGADKANRLRRSQQAERQRAMANIEAEQKRVSNLTEERIPLATEVRVVEAKVGPLKYVAELLYGKDNAESHLDDAVRFIIILLVIVFDPLAVLLVIAGNFSLRQIAKEKEEKSGGYEVNIPPVAVAPKQKRKQKAQTTEQSSNNATEQSSGDEPLNATLMEPIPMTKEELDEFKRKYTRDGRSKFAKYVDDQ